MTRDLALIAYEARTNWLLGRGILSTPWDQLEPETRRMFALEARAKRSRLAETEVLALRQHEAVPILADFKTWLTQMQPQVLPKSPMNDALRYTLNQWDALRRYSDTGFLAMDNNATERINKLIARGRVYAEFPTMRSSGRFS